MLIGQQKSPSRSVQSQVVGEPLPAQPAFSITPPRAEVHPEEGVPPPVESPMGDPPERVEEIQQEDFKPTPTVEQRRFSAPQSEWDPARWATVSAPVCPILLTCEAHHRLSIRSRRHPIFPRGRIICLRKRTCSRPQRNIQILREICITRSRRKRPKRRSRSKSSRGKPPRGRQRESSQLRSLNRSRNLKLSPTASRPAPPPPPPPRPLPTKNLRLPSKAELAHQWRRNGRHTAMRGMTCPKSSDMCKPLRNTVVVRCKFSIRLHPRAAARTSSRRLRRLPDVQV